MESPRPSLIEAVRRQVGPAPFDLAVVLGSGLGDAVRSTEVLTRFSYRDYDDLPPSRVEGHAGYLAVGLREGRRILFFVGRSHLYEGLDARTVSAPARLAHALGCRKLLLSNAAGGICPDFRPGDFMFITDHINLLGDNPLRGEQRSPFIDLVGLYRQELFPQLAEFAAERGIRLHAGVLTDCPGPSYETPAEVRALARLGADAVSMSTIPEAIMARYLGMDVAGVSLIANPAAGLGSTPLRHEEVLAAADLAAANFAVLLGEAVRIWCPHFPGEATSA